LTDFPERFQDMKSISLYKEGRLLRQLKVLGVRSVGETLILKTELVDRDAAEACVGTSILIEPSERVTLPPDSFWIDELVGLKVVDDVDGRPLGVVSNFLSAGANELYEVRDPEGGLHYIPAVGEFIRLIDVENGVLRVRLIEGLWD
jgi:16S rRNA processing protein RimM